MSIEKWPQPEKKAEVVKAPEEKPILKSEEKEAKRAERYGFEEAPELRKIVGKGVIDTLGSVFGARFIWELPKTVVGYFKKKEQRGKISESTLALLQEAHKAETMKQTKEKEGERGPIALKIEEVNKKLRETKMPAKEKLALRREMAEILKEYRRAGADLEEAKTEKIGNLLDLYINNSAQTMVAAREAVNTVSVVAMMPWLRTVGYTALAGAERAVKAAQDYEKTHFREKGRRLEKLGFLAKNLTVDAAKEMYNGLVGNFFKKEVTKTKTAAEFASSMFKLMRAAGLAEFEQALRSGALTMQEGAQKFWETLEQGNLGETLKQGGENWKMNVERLLSYVGLSENPKEAMQKLETEREIETGERQEEKIKEILENKEKIRELATIRKGEGITHTFVRQLENDPSVHGFKGDANNQVEVHRWAQKEAYQLAVKNGYINVSSGEETRVFWDPKNPSAYIIKENGSVEVLNKNEYLWHPQKEIKTEIGRAQRISKHFDEIYKPEQWKAIKDLKAADVIEGKFGPPAKEISTIAETDSRIQTREYLTELKEKTDLKIKNNETVEEYIRRAKNARSLETPVAEAPEETKAEFVKPKEVAAPREAISPKVEAGVASIETSDGSIKGFFKYNENKEITGFYTNGEANMLESRKLLHDDWFGRVQLKSKSTQELAMAQSLIPLRAANIWQTKKLLNTLEAQGHGTTPEAKFLKEQIIKSIQGIEKKYGEIFKK
jgi:hypothetical protein